MDIFVLQNFVVRLYLLHFPKSVNALNVLLSIKFKLNMKNVANCFRIKASKDNFVYIKSKQNLSLECIKI